MLRLVSIVTAALAAAAPAFPQPRQNGPSGQLDGNITLFTILAAANASGYDADLNSPTNSPVRKIVRDYIAGMKLQSLPPIQRLLRDHRPADPNAELGQYISFALFSKGPPEFKPVRPDIGWPPDAGGLFELPPLLAAFYEEAKIAELWEKLQSNYESAIAQYTEPVSRAVLEVNSYLRNPTSGYLGSRFNVYVDLLGAPNQVQTRNYIDDSYVVVTPAAELPLQDIRHAYLHYLADPLGIKFSEDLKKKSALGDYALGSPLISDMYKKDFVRLATECFIKAVESRIARKPALVDQALREGFVLTPAFAELLVGYEQQEQAMRLYFPDMVAMIDLKREEQRLDHVEFVSKPAERTIQVTSVVTPAEPVLSGAAKTLAEAEKAYTDRDLERAKATYLRVLKESDQNPVHAKAYYGLARIAVLQRDPETGDRFFRKVLELDPDASTKAWSLLYLGRLADSQKDREEAQEFYRQALAVPGAPDSVREAAEKGLQEAFTNKQ
ncbi:MAG: tetratricopeptide repeat protein [Bryobacterales bacterium]|nr:tetratricopeptide repeat protein [Bryobacterales bacterium]